MKFYSNISNFSYHFSNENYFQNQKFIIKYTKNQNIFYYKFINYNMYIL